MSLLYDVMPKWVKKEAKTPPDLLYVFEDMCFDTVKTKELSIIIIPIKPSAKEMDGQI